MATYTSLATSVSRPPAGAAMMPAPRLQPALGRTSDDLTGMAYKSPWSRLPIRQPLRLYERLREEIPIIDAAIVHLRQLVGCPCIEAEDDTKAEIEQWLWDDLRVNQIQRGAKPWLSTHIDNMLLYGRAHAEIVLTNARDDLYGLLELHPGTIGLRRRPDGFTCDVVQFGQLVEPVVFPDWKVITSVHDIRTDDPNGTSVLWGLPFVAEIYSKILDGRGKTHQRFGTPSYTVTWEPPDDFHDPQGALTASIMGPIQSRFEEAMRARAEGKVKDFFAAGKINIGVIGAAGEELDFSEPVNELVDQIISKTGLPPMLLGINRSTTERMATEQAKLLAELVDSMQNELTPGLTDFVMLRQQLRGGDTNFKLKWEGASLQDRQAEATADFTEQQARQLSWTNDLALWRLGFWNGLELVRKYRPDLEQKEDDELKAYLPDLQLLPPAPPAPPQPFGARGQTPSGTPPGMGPNGNEPATVGRSLSYHEDWLPRNGHGDH